MKYTLKDVCRGALDRLADLQPKLNGTCVQINTSAGVVEILFGICENTLHIYGYYFPAGTDIKDAGSRITLGQTIAPPQDDLEKVLNRANCFTRETVDYCIKSYKKAVQVRTEINALTVDILKKLL